MDNVLDERVEVIADQDKQKSCRGQESILKLFMTRVCKGVLVKEPREQIFTLEKPLAPQEAVNISLGEFFLFAFCRCFRGHC